MEAAARLAHPNPNPNLTLTLTLTPNPNPSPNPKPGHARRNDFNDWSEEQDGVGKFQLQLTLP